MEPARSKQRKKDTRRPASKTRAACSFHETTTPPFQDTLSRFPFLDPCRNYPKLPLRQGGFSWLLPRAP